MDRRKPQSCVGCALADLGEGFLSSEGTCSNGVLIVGEAAGAHEARASLPFRPNAPAGGFLERILNLAGLPRADFGLFNIVNCKPPGNELVGAPWEAGAIAHCRPNVDATVARLKPRVLLALGNTALRALTGNPTLSITEMRGFVLESIYGIPLISSYHPSFMIRGAEHLTGVMLHDLKRAHQIGMRGLPTKTPTNYVLTPTETEARDYAWSLYSSPETPIAYDIETEGILGVREPEALGEKCIIQIQFSSAIGQAIVLPWRDTYIDIAKDILALPNLKMGWFDRLFDRKVLRAQGVVINGETHDLMDAWGHCLHRESRLELWEGSPLPIYEVVNKRLPVTLKGLDPKTGEIVPVKVIDWHRHETTKQFLEIKVDGSRQPIWCTSDHLIYANDSWRRADKVTTKDYVALPKITNYDVILGTIMGDGYVNENGRLAFYHSLLQRDWCQAKARAVGAFYTEDDCKAMASVVITKELRNQFYSPTKRKIFIEPTPSALAVWYGDDGYYKYQSKSKYGSPQISIFNIENWDELVAWFEKTFGKKNISVIKPREAVNGGTLCISYEARKVFFEMIAPYLHPSMSRKLPPELRDKYNGWMEKPTDVLWGKVLSVGSKPINPSQGVPQVEYCVTVDHPSQSFFTRGGLVHNCQPNFMSSKDDAHGDKGVPSKLMSLQSCLSFYYPEEGPWKGTVRVPGPGLGSYLGMMNLLRWYGAKDADYTFRLGMKLFTSLKKLGLW